MLKGQHPLRPLGSFDVLIHVFHPCMHTYASLSLSWPFTFLHNPTVY